MGKKSGFYAIWADNRRPKRRGSRATMWMGIDLRVLEGRNQIAGIGILTMCRAVSWTGRNVGIAEMG